VIRTSGHRVSRSTVRDFVLFPPISTQRFFTLSYLATTSTAQVANRIRHPSHLGCSRFHPSSRWATRTGRSTSEVCFSLPTGTAFCRSARTARRAVCPSSKHEHGHRISRDYIDTSADDFVGGPRTTSSFSGCTLPSASVSNSSVFPPCRCLPATRTSTIPQRKPRPATTNHMSL
jgi:hypothetical protein